MARVFERGRRYHPEGSPEYGHVIVLQRLYNALTAAYPMPLPASGVPPPSPTMFASLPAGPGTARPLHEITQDLKAGVAENQVGFGITTFRVGTKDRSFTDEARHKGMAYKTGKHMRVTIAEYRRLYPLDQSRRCLAPDCWADLQDICAYKGIQVASRYCLLVPPSRAGESCCWAVC
jgi:hypothetical protein